jgi:hypothetical protein
MANRYNKLYETNEYFALAKKGCKKCLGRGYLGLNVANEQKEVIHCKCITFKGKNDIKPN